MRRSRLAGARNRAECNFRDFALGYRTRRNRTPLPTWCACANRSRGRGPATVLGNSKFDRTTP